jgi:PAS domain S-box-containing protein
MAGGLDDGIDTSELAGMDRPGLEERLRESERRFKAAIDAIDGVLWTNNPDGEMVGGQPGWAALTGQAYEDYQGYGWAKAVHPDDAQPTVDAWQIAVATRKPFIFEHRVRCRDGAWRLFAIRAIPVEDDAGMICEWVGVHRDITAHRGAQDLLQRNAETFANLVASNPFGIYVVDADFKLRQFSQGARAVFDNVDQPIGKAFDDILKTIWNEPFASDTIEKFRHTLETGEPYVNVSSVEQRADIDVVEAYDWRIERITLPDGRFGIVCYFYDLSERNSYEEKLKQAVADKDLLAREIDHRVKNSLTIVGSLLSMQRGTSTSPETRAALADAADRVIAVARIHERLHQSHQLGVMAFADYLEQLCTDLAGSMQRKGVVLNFRADTVNLPAEQALSLALIANELVTNAFKHGCAAGATAVSVTLEQQPDALVLTVSDNGAGLPKGQSDQTPSLGFKLIDALCRQLEASTEFPAPGEIPTFRLTIADSALKSVK